MKRYKPIIIGAAGIVILCVGIIAFELFSNKDNAPNENIIKQNEEILNSLNYGESTKSQDFDNVDDMMNYVVEANSIYDITEAEKFLKDFFTACEENYAAKMLSYYVPELRTSALEEEAFPFFDRDNISKFNFTDISVSQENENSQEFTVNYTLNLGLKEEENPQYVLKRKDIFNLEKRSGVIYINAYKSKTTSSKKFK